jgi:transcriptional regulator with XRE-family HTH domain
VASASSASSASSQELLAERAGLSRRGIADLERGSRLAPYAHMIDRLATALALSEVARAALVEAGPHLGRPASRHAPAEAASIPTGTVTGLPDTPFRHQTMAPTTWIDSTRIQQTRARRGSAYRRVKPFLNLSLIGLLIVSFTTGWIASLLGLTEYPPHKYTSIGFFLAAGVHLAFHWTSLVAQARRLWSPQAVAVSLQSLPSQPKPLSSDEVEDGFDQLDEASVRRLNQWLRHHPGVRAVIHLQVDAA